MQYTAQYTARYIDPATGLERRRSIGAPSLDEARELFAALEPGARLTALDREPCPSPSPGGTVSRGTGLRPVSSPGGTALQPVSSPSGTAHPPERLPRGHRWCPSCQRAVTPKRDLTAQWTCVLLFVFGLLLIFCTAGLSLFGCALFLVIGVLDSIFPTKTCPICNAKARHLSRRAPTDTRPTSPSP